VSSTSYRRGRPAETVAGFLAAAAIFLKRPTLRRSDVMLRAMPGY
jgi:hypothetical protein